VRVDEKFGSSLWSYEDADREASKSRMLGLGGSSTNALGIRDAKEGWDTIEI
jgi:hypothetical protein